MDAGRAFVAGTLVVDASDFCPITSHFDLEFDMSAPPKFNLEGGGTSYPSAKGAIIFVEK